MAKGERGNRVLICILAAEAAILAVLFLGRQNRALMNAVAAGTGPIKNALGHLCAPVPGSVGEYLILVLAVLVVLGAVSVAAALVRGGQRRALLWRAGLSLAALILGAAALFSLFWGVNYYTDTFQDKAGLSTRGVSTEELYAVTAYFADRANDTAGRVPRNAQGVFAADRAEIYALAPTVYTAAEAEFPFLAKDDVMPKRALFSPLMSRMNFTGFFFPLTGEANLNDDSPACMLPATIAHEMAHQRGIASEQECNFLAVLVSVTSGSEVYEYSGWLFGFTHLNNALYRADPQRWKEVYGTLNESVRADLADNNDYWSRFEGKTASVSQNAYDTFLKSYGESDGIESYGAVVDLLVAYYGAAAQ